MLRRTFLKVAGAALAALGFPAAAKPLAPSGMAMMQDAAPARGPKIPAGVVITCPECGDQVAKALRDIYRGDPVRSSDFKPFGDYILAGAQMRCRCGEPYIRGGWPAVAFVHTDRGWL